MERSGYFPDCSPAFNAAACNQGKKDLALKIYNVIDKHFEEFLCVLCFVFFVVVSNLQIVVRYLLSAYISLPWTEELARYSFLWCMFLGLSWGIRENEHLTVDILKLFLSPGMQRVQAILVSLVIIVFTVIVGWQGFEVFWGQMRMGQKLAASGLPMWLVYLAFPASFFLVLVRISQRIYRLSQRS